MKSMELCIALIHMFMLPLHWDSSGQLCMVNKGKHINLLSDSDLVQ